LLHVRRAIGDGRDSSLWFDPWLPVGRLVDILGENMPLITGTQDWKVSNIFHNQIWNLHHSFLHSIRDLIQDVHLSDTTDTWLWIPTSTMDFCLASAWDVTRLQGAKFNLHNVFWFPSASPKMSACALKAFHDRLPTRERLKRFGIINEDLCVLCSSSTETRDHIFFECPYVAYIWTLCKLKLGYHPILLGNIVEEASQIRNKFKVKDQTYILARLAFQVTIWHIWLERNRRIFQHQQLNKIMVFRRIYEDIHMMLRTCHWKVNNKEALLANWSM
jgi:hypothetical protein